MVKAEKRARKKRLIKKRESLLERAKEHRIKAETEKGSKDTTIGYWIGEAERFEGQAREVEDILGKLDGKKKAEKIDTSKEAEPAEKTSGQ